MITTLENKASFSVTSHGWPAQQTHENKTRMHNIDKDERINTKMICSRFF